MTFWPSRRRLRSPSFVALLLLGLAVVLAACGLATQTTLAPASALRGFGGASGQQVTVTSPAQLSPARAAAGSGAPQAAPAPAQAQTGSDASSNSPLPSLNRMVIRNANLSLQVADVDAAVDRARQLAQAGGGFVSGSNTRLEQGRTVADLNLQVRADALDTTLQSLRGLGKVDSETSSSQDVTEEYVDLDANLRNLQASESAILRLMDRAQRIEDIISLQRELTTVRGQIERIQGRKTYLERRTDMATVSVSLHLPPLDNASGSGGFDPLAVARRGWNASLAVLRGVAELAIVVAAFSWWLVPFLSLAAYFFVIRRRPRAADA
jgi:hypothetical protein